MTLFTVKRSQDDDTEIVTLWARRELGLLTPKEADRLSRLEAEEAEGSGLHRMTTVMDELDQFASTAEVRAMREAALHARPYRQHRSRVWIGAGAIAACILAVLLFTPLASDVASGHWAPVREKVATSSYATNGNERREVRLRDGSVIALGPSSQVSVTFSSQRRGITLLKGQALFKVAKNAEWPFVVVAGNQEITAVGTAFDVHVVPNGSMSVLLVEGKVSVAPVSRSLVSELTRSLNVQRLLPGQKLSAAADGSRIVQNVALDQDVLTSGHMMVLEDDTIGEAVDKLNRLSSLHIVISDPQIASLKISGAYNVENPDDFVVAIENFYPIAAEKRSKDVVALKWSGN